jgi:hypothetical protein
MLINWFQVEDPFADFAESLTSLFWALKDDNLQSFR